MPWGDIAVEAVFLVVGVAIAVAIAELIDSRQEKKKKWWKWWD